MKLLRDNFANISNLLDMNLVITFIYPLFLTANDLIEADSLSLNSITIFVFLGSKQSETFLSRSIFYQL